MTPHRIRLLGPWEAQPLEGWDEPSQLWLAQAPGPSRVALPSTWDAYGWRGFTGGVVRYRRRFGQPRTLEAHEQVWLCGDQVLGAVTVRLNDTVIAGQLAETAAIAIDITAALQPRNVLELDLARATPGGILGLVLLEIRDYRQAGAAPPR